MESHEDFNKRRREALLKEERMFSEIRAFQMAQVMNEAAGRGAGAAGAAGGGGSTERIPKPLPPLVLSLDTTISIVDLGSGNLGYAQGIGGSIGSQALAGFPDITALTQFTIDLDDEIRVRVDTYAGLKQGISTLTVSWEGLVGGEVELVYGGGGDFRTIPRATPNTHTTAQPFEDASTTFRIHSFNVDGNTPLLDGSVTIGQTASTEYGYSLAPVVCSLVPNSFVYNEETFLVTSLLMTTGSQIEILIPDTSTILSTIWVIYDAEYPEYSVSNISYQSTSGGSHLYLGNGNYTNWSGRVGQTVIFKITHVED